MDMIGTLLGSLVLAIILIAIVVKLLAWLYVRASNDVAFVRTGLGGARVVRDGGALVIPVVHRTTPVNLATLRVEVARTGRGSLQTRDNMRVDVKAAFYLHVAREPEAVLRAATTLGERTNSAEAIAALLEGKFVDALRAEAAEVDMHTLHQKRGEFVKRVAARTLEDLAHNGLELESVSLMELDQASREFFNPQNAFDAEGLTRLSRDIEDRRRIRNEIERDTEVALLRKALEVEGQQLEIEKAKLEIVREAEFARLAQQQEIAQQRARQMAEVKREESLRSYEAEQASIEAQRQIESLGADAKRSVETARVQAEHAVAVARVEADQKLKLATIAQSQALEVAVAQREAEVARAALGRIQAQADVDSGAHQANQRVRESEVQVNEAVEKARLAAELEVARQRIGVEQAVRSAETAKSLVLDLARVGRERDLELAEHERVIQVAQRSVGRFEALVASEAAHSKAVEAQQAVAAAREKARAAGERDVAQIEADRARLVAAGEAEAATISLSAQAHKLSVEAAGKSQLYAAENSQAEHIVTMKTRLASLEVLPDIIRESARPMEAIDKLSIVQVEGLHGPHAAAGDGAGVPSGNLAEQLMTSALRYRAQAPLVDRILQEVGMDGSSLGGLAAPAAALQPMRTQAESKVAPAPVAEPSTNAGRHSPRPAA